MTNTILLVEDHPPTLEVISMVLHQHGYRVIEAADGIEALNALLTDTPELILTDLRMPNMDGLELSRHVKSASQYQHIPIVLITATPPSHTAASPYFTRVIQKPCPAEALISVISELLPAPL